MFPSEAREKVYDEGVWEIASGAVNETFTLKNLDVGYQYKIYLNASNASEPTIRRFETEIGLSQNYSDFIQTGKTIQFLMGSLVGASNMSMLVYKQSSGVLTNRLNFTGTTTGAIEWRYLITRHKLYL